MQHYYLLNGTVKKGGEMPKEKGIDKQTQYPHNYHDFKNWLSSLQPCEIDDSEFHRIINYIYPTDKKTHYPENPIDITDIVEEKPFCDADCPDVDCGNCDHPSCCIKVNKIYFKQPTEKQVESECEAVEFLIWVRNYPQANNFNAKQLYEIFKNR